MIYRGCADPLSFGRGRCADHLPEAGSLRSFGSHSLVPGCANVPGEGRADLSASAQPIVLLAASAHPGRAASRMLALERQDGAAVPEDRSSRAATRPIREGLVDQRHHDAPNPTWYVT